MHLKGKFSVLGGVHLLIIKKKKKTLWELPKKPSTIRNTGCQTF